MDFKGTKGEWRVERNDNEIYIVADSPSPPHHGNIVCVMDNDNTNIEADSRLMISAPELLKSLQKLVEMMKSPLRIERRRVFERVGRFGKGSGRSN